jgi:carboxypeptidase-like protein
MIRTLFNLFLVLFVIQTGSAQSIAVKITDAKSGESLPYATIKINESTNLISNAEGYFSLSESNNDTSVLTVTHLGYVGRQVTVGELKNQNYTIRMEPGVFELENITISNVKPDPNAIMAEVKKNLLKHYKNNELSTKDKLFCREATFFKPKKIELEITKSTGFSKKALETVNDELNAFSSKTISKPPQEFKDVLCNYYNSTQKKDNKKAFFTKLEVEKAALLQGGDRLGSLEDMKKTAEKIFLKHLDTTKYYRIKSGLFGSRDTISLKKGFNERKRKVKSTRLSNTKTNLISTIYANNFLQSNRLDFVNKPELYEYTYEGKILNNENDIIYVLRFEPRKSKAKYTGKLYVSETDYAVVRCDYTLPEGERLNGLNLKLLLGVKVYENISTGTIIYKKNPFGEGYYLQYVSEESGQYFYINRPLKFIELSDSEKDVVAFDLKVEGNSIEKTEFLNISRSEISEDSFNKVKEEEFNYINLKRYDPTIWKDFVAIEPLEEMKQFKAID